ncbi:MAG: phosphoribosylformylglycinamidine cyclo-ligase [Gallionella sp.]
MNHSNNPAAGLSYRDAGVDIDAGDQLVENIKPYAKRTMRPEVLSGIGGFGGLVEISKKYKEPVLVSGTDGVGTKLKLAFELNIHNTVGIDLVGMSVNDILVQGAEPLFFLDYFACGKLDVPAATEVIKGIANGCEQAGCALIGGETAEMPGMYPVGEYDLAGFAVGVVEKANIITGADIKPGDVVLGMASNGAHSNGYSLVRKIIERSNPDLSAKFDGERTLTEVIMAPTRIYVKPLLALMQSLTIKGMAHITGGGITENVPRVLPENVVADIDSKSWELPKLFKWLRKQGNVAEQEMYRTFNCGIGMVVIVAAADADKAISQLQDAGETVTRIGVIRARNGEEHQTQVR